MKSCAYRPDFSTRKYQVFSGLLLANRTDPQANPQHVVNFLLFPLSKNVCRVNSQKMGCQRYWPDFSTHV
jgi:hypothetical protein